MLQACHTCFLLCAHLECTHPKLPVRVCVCVHSLRRLSVTGLRVSLGRRDAKGSCTNTHTHTCHTNQSVPSSPGPCQPLLRLADCRSQSGKTQLKCPHSRQGVNEEVRAGCQLTDKEVLIDLVLSLQLCLPRPRSLAANLAAIRRRLQQIAGAAAAPCTSEWKAFFILFYRLYSRVRRFMGAIRLELKVAIVDIYCGAFRSKNKCSSFILGDKRNYFNRPLVRSAARTFAPVFHAGLYAMIEHSPEDRGPAMHPCGQLNRPPSKPSEGPLSRVFTPNVSVSLRGIEMYAQSPPPASRSNRALPFKEVAATCLFGFIFK